MNIDYLYIEAMRSHDTDLKEADREEKYLMKELMGEDFHTFFHEEQAKEEVEQERNQDHALDSKF